MVYGFKGLLLFELPPGNLVSQDGRERSVRIMRLVTSRNQGDGGKSREARSHGRRRDGWEPGAWPWVCIHSVPSAAWAPSARSQPPSSGRGSGSVPTPGTVPAGRCGPWPVKLRQTLCSSTWVQVQLRGAGQRGSRPRIEAQLEAHPAGSSGA